MKKTCVSLFLAFMMVWASVVPVYASDSAEDIMPLLENTYDCAVHFDITASGKAEFTVDYCGRETCTGATVTVKIQKRTLLVFWTTVYEWEATSTEQYDFLYGSTQLEDTGTYRAVFKVEIHGTSGVTDVIEDKIQQEYS